ncbi:hypothetical protein NIIDNTM18_32130 [Mycolicibacterium litorale]|uniref:Response regulatory domain-containing protein n=2 Tax=Mycolicibacterium litorale TaxID=758802 RepID=A0A6S6P5S9_9MYCO|nr:hypothetical protein NIIDNTM18_32130 [Mycolicibacterium litorale]
MGRAEGEHEGLVLIDAVREFNSDVPIFIYSTPKSEDFIAECERRGAQAVVSDPRDLFKAVLGAVADAKSKTLKMSPA